MNVPEYIPDDEISTPNGNSEIIEYHNSCSYCGREKIENYYCCHCQKENLHNLINNHKCAYCQQEIIQPEFCNNCSTNLDCIYEDCCENDDCDHKCEKVCGHEFIHDLVDIDPDHAQHVIYCSRCYFVFVE